MEFFEGMEVKDVNVKYAQRALAHIYIYIYIYICMCV